MVLISQEQVFFEKMFLNIIMAIKITTYNNIEAVS
jgi:hypothetical protein